MRWIVFILYIVCFGCYVLFTRQPDFFDSERAPGIIVQHDGKLKARFFNGMDTMYAHVPYPLLHQPGKRVEVIYETADPAAARQYGVLGYWLTISELLVSLLIISVLYFVAASITSNPTPEALLEELEMGKKKPRKPKYEP